MKIKAQEENIRIDKYLHQLSSLSREQINKIIKIGGLKVNEKEVKPSYLVKLNDEIDFNESLVESSNLLAQDIDLDIVYEDKYLMVINKPSGLVVHPGSGNKDHTLVNGLLYHTDSLSEGSDSSRPGIVHRLDKDTSGLMIVAKTNEAHVALAEGFKNKTIEREYVALLEGVLPHKQGLIDAPIGRDPSNFQKFTVSKNGKKALTYFTVIKTYQKYTLVRLKLKTGRTHQIRVHLAYIGYPVFNDPLYSKHASTAFGQFLHSEHLKFTHPITGEVLEFRSPLPDEFAKFLETLN